MILSYISGRQLQAAYEQHDDYAQASFDLGRSYQNVPLSAQGVSLPYGNILSWETVKQIIANENACFSILPNGDIEKIQTFSEEFNRLYSLYPVPELSEKRRVGSQKKHSQRKRHKTGQTSSGQTSSGQTSSGQTSTTQASLIQPNLTVLPKESAPTMLISGIPMHRIKETTPQRDTKEKIRAASPIRGNVLDTATGLGYTAIAAAAKANSVTTIEIDPKAQEICQINPWSQSLFNDPKITQKIGDSFDIVEQLPSDSFDVILHDPPMFNLAGHLYSADFYSELLRILRPRGILFHYIGNPESKSGANVTKGVIRRINDTGFVRMRPQPRAFGISAQKP